jgi:hypothetical protein
LLLLFHLLEVERVLALNTLSWGMEYYTRGYWARKGEIICSARQTWSAERSGAVIIFS